MAAGGKDRAGVGVLNGEIRKLTPWLLAEGAELSASSTKPKIHVRAKQLTNSSGLLLAVNTTGTAMETELSMPIEAGTKLRPLLGVVPGVLDNGKIAVAFKPYETMACVWGLEPKE